MRFFGVIGSAVLQVAFCVVCCVVLLMGNVAAAGARSLDSAGQARMAYICALADMAVYGTSEDAPGEGKNRAVLQNA